MPRVEQPIVVFKKKCEWCNYYFEVYNNAQNACICKTCKEFDKMKRVR